MAVTYFFTCICRKVFSLIYIFELIPFLIIRNINIFIKIEATQKKLQIMDLTLRFCKKRWVRF